MKLVLTEQSKVIKLAAIFRNLKVFTNNLMVYLDATKGIFIQGMDDTHCCLCEVKIMPAWFDIFEFDADIDMVTLGINTNILHKIINTYTEGQYIELLAHGNTDKLTINFAGKETVFNKHFDIPLMNIEMDILAVSEEEKQVDLTIETKKFVELINQMQIFNDTIKIHFLVDTVEFTASGDEGEMSVNVSLDDVIEYAIMEELVLTQTYCLRFLQMMCAFNKLSPEFVMRFSEERPMEGRYELGNNSYMSFFVSERLAND